MIIPYIMIRQLRAFSTSSTVFRHSSNAAKAANLGQNLSQFDILSGSEIPRNNIEMISKNAFVFSDLHVIRSPQQIDGNDHVIGALLLDNQIFEANLGKEEGFLKKGRSHIITIPQELLNIFQLIYPKPELIVLGLGMKTRMLDPSNKTFFNELGIRVEVSTTKAAALTFDLLATERTPIQVSGLLLPPNI